MEKTIKQIIVDTEAINVITEVDGIRRITQLNLEAEKGEIEEIFKIHNLNSVTIYPYDIKIVRALVDNEEQLKDYMETCRKAHYSEESVEVPDTIPEIKYEFKDLKRSFIETENKEIRRIKQVEMYNIAKTTQNMFRGAKGRVVLEIGILDKGYFAVQELLQARNREQVRALNPGKAELRKSLREELYTPGYARKVVQLSKTYAKEKTN